MSKQHYSNGGHTAIIMAVMFALLFLAAGAFGVWAFMNYQEAQKDVDSKIAAAEAEARRDQAEKTAAKYLEQAALPYVSFVGPDDYGRVTFNYPKTWAVYEASPIEDNGDDYKAYFAKQTVPKLDDKTIYALRVSILQASYDDVLQDYNREVEDGGLKSSAVDINGETGTRFDGKLSEEMRGSVVLFKIRDKTLVIRTDSPVFMKEFEEIIKTIRFDT